MIIIYLILGLFLPTVSGWMALSVLEGNKPVLMRGERWVLGFVLGLTLTMYLTFLMHIGYLASFTRLGFLLVQLILVALIAMVWRKKRAKKRLSPPAIPETPPLPRWLKVSIVILAFWVTLKILIGLGLLVSTPPYFDDVFNNWNMRGKTFFFTQELTLEMEIGNDIVSSEGVSSYPPTVPMIKAWLASLAGRWHEGLINSIHMLWYLSALALVFFALRRVLTLPFALLGAYILAGLPLYLIHSSHAYADLFLSVHIFAAVSLLFSAVRAQDPAERSSFFRLGAFATALLVFTKNEALVMHIPALLLVLCASLLILKKQKRMTGKEVRSVLLWYGGLIAAVAIPWILFKWAHGLPFGNAKSIRLDIAWQPMVLYAIWINLFFEGNWLLLFPLLIGLLISRWRRAFASPLLVLSAFFLIVYVMQLLIFLFTGLSTEVLRQTGYSRGLIHLMPVVVMIVTMLVAEFFPQRKAR